MRRLIPLGCGNSTVNARQEAQLCPEKNGHSFSRCHLRRPTAWARKSIQNRSTNTKRSVISVGPPNRQAYATAVRRIAREKKYVVQRHAARSLHYEFRLEADRVLKSWAVPKGPPAKSGEERLAIMVEDHPLSYASFEGTIPEGNYGAGDVKIWDEGWYETDSGDSDKSILANLKKGKLDVTLHGRRLKGRYLLTR